MDRYKNLTDHYSTPRTDEMVIYFVAETPAVQIPSYPYLSLVVNKPARTKNRTFGYSY